MAKGRVVRPSRYLRLVLIYHKDHFSPFKLIWLWLSSEFSHPVPAAWPAPSMAGPPCTAWSCPPGLMLKVLWMKLRRMQVAVLMTACMCEKSCMAHNGKLGAEPFGPRL